MIPKTIHKMDVFTCISAMQKAIRRGLEREAMQFACEMGHTSKGFATMAVNRLLIISYEDIGLASPEIIPLVRTCCEQAKEWFDLDPNDPRKMGKWRMAVGTAIRAMCRAKKSREGDHFQAAVGLATVVSPDAPDVPDWAYDKHTRKGKKLGRGWDHFRKEGAKLVPAPRKKDEYEDEAYEIWEARESQAAKGKRAKSASPTLFD